MDTPKESSNIDSARDNSMSIQSRYIQRVQYIKIDAKGDHHNYGTSQFGYGRWYLSQYVILQLRHNSITFSIIMKIGYGTYLVLLNLGTIIK